MVEPAPLRHYVIVRSDIPVGNIAAQLVHAAGESSRLAPELPQNTHAVVLEAASERVLLELEAQLNDTALGFCSIREPDAPFNGALMAIGIAPSPDLVLRREARFLRRLPLFANRRPSS